MRKYVIAYEKLIPYFCLISSLCDAKKVAEVQMLFLALSSKLIELSPFLVHLFLLFITA